MIESLSDYKGHLVITLSQHDEVGNMVSILQVKKYFASEETEYKHKKMLFQGKTTEGAGLVSWCINFHTLHAFQ